LLLQNVSFGGVLNYFKRKRWDTDELRFPKSELNLNFNKTEELSRMLLELLL